MKYEVDQFILLVLESPSVSVSNKVGDELFVLLPLNEQNMNFVIFKKKLLNISGLNSYFIFQTWPIMDLILAKKNKIMKQIGVFFFFLARLRYST